MCYNDSVKGKNKSRQEGMMINMSFKIGFTSNIGKLNKGLNINKTKELNYIIISLLNTIPEVIKKAQEFKDKMKTMLYGESKEDLEIVLEQTGAYHLPILTYLLDKEYCVIA